MGLPPGTGTSSIVSSERVVAIVQARLGSVRLPGKVLSPVLGKPVLAHLVERLSRADSIDEVVLAIPDTAANNELAVLADELRIGCFRGDEDDVLLRYSEAASAAKAKVVVRITGDCPLVAPEVVDRVIFELTNNRYDYIHTGKSFPKGFDVEAFTVEALQRATLEAIEPYDREHVTPYLRRNKANRINVVETREAVPDERVTLDEPEDLDVIAAVFSSFGHNRFTFENVAE